MSLRTRIAGLSLLLASAGADTTLSAATPDSVQAHLDRMVQRGEVPGIQYLVVTRAGLLFEAAAGVRDASVCAPAPCSPARFVSRAVIHAPSTAATPHLPSRWQDSTLIRARCWATTQALSPAVMVDWTTETVASSMAARARRRFFMTWHRPRPAECDARPALR